MTDCHTDPNKSLRSEIARISNATSGYESDAISTCSTITSQLNRYEKLMTETGVRDVVLKFLRETKLFDEYNDPKDLETEQRSNNVAR